MVDLYPPPELVTATRRLRDFEWTRINCDNRMMAMARRELGRKSNRDITEEDRAKLAMTLFGSDTPLSFFNPLLTQAEKHEEKIIELAVKASPFNPFVKRISGVDTKTFGRLWALLGDPLWDEHNDCDRTIGMLFQYSGVGDPTDKRRVGHKTKHNPLVGPRLHVIAKSTGVVCGRGKPQYRAYYDQLKHDCQGRVHTMPCNQCGTHSAANAAKQKALDQAGFPVRVKKDIPAGIGDPWKPGHIDGHAYRMVKRQFLRDLFEYSLKIG